MTRDLKRRLLALESRGGALGDDISQLTPEEFDELLDFWARASDGEKLANDEHARFRTLDAKVIKRGNPYEHLTEAELDLALAQYRIRGEDS